MYQITDRGYLTFGRGHLKLVPPSTGVTDVPLLAAMWSDMFMFPVKSVNSRAKIWYRETSKATDLKLAKQLLVGFKNCGSAVKPRSLFIVTYEDMTSHCDHDMIGYEADNVRRQVEADAVLDVSIYILLTIKKSNCQC